MVRVVTEDGPRMRQGEGRVVPAFRQQALTGESLTVFGDGRQTRSFCFVSDLIEGIYRLLMSERVEPTNIGNPHEMTILEFARAVIELTSSKSEIHYKQLPQDDPKVRQPDISRARRVLEWEPRVDLAEGLRPRPPYFQHPVPQARA